MKAYRTSDDLPLTRRLKGRIGHLLAQRQPRVMAEVSKRPFSRKWGPVGRLIRNAVFLRAVEHDDHDLIQIFLRDYWSSSASLEFFDEFTHRFETVFMKHHHGVVERISDAMRMAGGGFGRLVELGCGDGRVLQYLSGRLEGVPRFVGVDLNEEQVRKTREILGAVQGLEFHAAEALSWLSANPARGTVLFTNGGVCEYLTRGQMVTLLDKVKDAGGPCIVTITETLAINHDLAREPESYPYGHEFAFSHNYRALLLDAGFEVSYEKDRFTAPDEEHHPARWLQIVGRWTDMNITRTTTQVSTPQ